MLAFDYKKRVRYGETDMMGYLYNGNYAQLFNEYMNELYRIANEIVNDGGVKYKFILIE